jgi:hypothetical protein
MMPCNYTGFQAPATTAGWGITDFDCEWFCHFITDSIGQVHFLHVSGSNALNTWSATLPMNDEELLLQQASITTAAQPATKVWVYRNSVYGYPWYTGVRAILDDPSYSPWFIKFSGHPPYTSPPCDSNYDPPLCTDYFHTQMDTPKPSGQGGYGTCPGTACNCGTKPCGCAV